MENKFVIRSAFVVSLFILLCRIFGMFRDMLMASNFGTTMEMSAFIIAFTVPNLFRSLLGEGALSTAFVPVFTETMERYGRERVWQFASRMLSLLLVMLAVLTALGFLVITALRLFSMPEQKAEILRLLQIMLPYLFFLCTSAFLAGMLNAMRRFTMPAASPVLLNLVMIAGLLWLCPALADSIRGRLTILAWLVVLAGFLQMSAQALGVIPTGFRFRFSLDLKDTAVRQVGRLMAVSSLGAGTHQINVLCDKLLALLAGPSAASYLYYAERLYYLPLSLVATALGTVMLPAFSTLAARSQFDGIRRSLNDLSRYMVFIMMPCVFGIIALALPIIGVVYQRNNFDAASVGGTRLALQCYAPGLLFSGMVRIMVPVFYAMKDMRTPVFVGAVCALLNIILSFALIKPFSHAGIALGTVIAALAQALWLARLLRARIGIADWRKLIFSWLRAALAGVAMAAAVTLAYPHVSRWAHAFLPTGIIPRLAALLAAMLLAAAVYLAAAVLMRCPEISELFRMIKQRRKAPERTR